MTRTCYLTATSLLAYRKLCAERSPDSPETMSWGNPLRREHRRYSSAPSSTVRVNGGRYSGSSKPTRTGMLYRNDGSPLKTIFSRPMGACMRIAIRSLGELVPPSHPSIRFSVVVTHSCVWRFPPGTPTIPRHTVVHRRRQRAPQADKSGGRLQRRSGTAGYSST